MPDNTPLTDAALAELDRLREVAKLGPMVSVHIVSPGYEHCANLCTRLDGHKSDYPMAMMQAEWADVLAAEHNAYPALRQRLAEAERERDTAKAEVARQWITLTEIAELVEDDADCDDSEEGIANRPNLAMQVQMMADKATQCNPQAYAWLAARDASMKREGAAEWLENAAREGGYYERSSEGMLEEAKQLREGK